MGLISKIISKYINVEEIEKEIVENRIKKILSKVTLGANSAFYEQANVLNFQNNSQKISIGENCHLRGNLQVFAYGGSITFGNYCYLGENSYIWSGDKVEIGNHVLISHQVNIIDSNSHEIDAIERQQGYKHILTNGHPKEKGNIETAPIIIKDHVWISFGAIILKGITIGEGAVVAAGSVVTKDVAPFTLVAGNPARLIKELPR